MKAYAISLAAGLLVGAIYSLIGVASPAPPAVALVGLLGILAGEQVLPLLKSLLQKQSVLQCWLHQVKPHMFGQLTRGTDAEIASAPMNASSGDGKAG